MERVDLTHTFTADMPVYPGDPKSTLIQISSIAKDGFTDHLLTTPMHVGTHMDAPLHMIEGGKTIDAIELDRFFGPGVLLDARNKLSVDRDILDNITVPKGAFILVYTGQDAKWNKDSYFYGYPLITEAFGTRAVELGVHAVGVDTPSVDEPPFATHKALLGKGVLVIEHMTNLGTLVNKKFDVIALPPKLTTDGATVRVIAQTLS